MKGIIVILLIFFCSCIDSQTNVKISEVDAFKSAIVYLENSYGHSKSNWNLILTKAVVQQPMIKQYIEQENFKTATMEDMFVEGIRSKYLKIDKVVEKNNGYHFHIQLAGQEAKTKKITLNVSDGSCEELNN